MKTVNVSSRDLIKRIEENMKVHRDEYLEALDARKAMFRKKSRTSVA